MGEEERKVKRRAVNHTINKANPEPNHWAKWHGGKVASI